MDRAFHVPALAAIKPGSGLLVSARPAGVRLLSNRRAALRLANRSPLPMVVVGTLPPSRQDEGQMTSMSVEPTASPFIVHVAVDAERALVRLIGELDVAGVPSAEGAIARAEAAAAARVEVDLSSLGFIDSSGLRVMLMARERAVKAGRRLVLHRGPAAVHRVFEMTAVERFFEFAD
jgi:anti-anti-sigma factor